MIQLKFFYFNKYIITKNLIQLNNYKTIQDIQKIVKLTFFSNSKNLNFKQLLQRCIILQLITTKTIKIISKKKTYIGCKNISTAFFDFFERINYFKKTKKKSIHINTNLIKITNASYVFELENNKYLKFSKIININVNISYSKSKKNYEKNQILQLLSI